ncbi:unnamed protein product [Caenorhabditis auriculariae]|uniref:Uncharacterized protein n=1 Tax=Caenorhabditis auriculariae TaxID=2777116 RepID=A0A8S1HIE8_9PELO|nr:unnamed protein product [Caenorhabditis auriculariae]
MLTEGRNLSLGLLAVGAVSTANALYATLTKPFSYFRHPEVINVHWISTIIIAAGLAPLLLRHKTIKSETVVVVVNVLSMCICVACFLADLLNIAIVNMRETVGASFIRIFIAEDETKTRERLAVYNTIDMILCAVGAVISFVIVRTRLTAFPTSHVNNGKRLMGFGLGLTILSSLRVANHVYERRMLVKMKQAVYIDMYTVDEFSWLVINLATAVIVILSSRGSRLINSCAYTLSGICIYPSFFYSWLNFRIMSASHTEFLTTKALISMALSFPHIACLLVVFLHFTSVMTHRESAQLSLQGLSRKIVIGFALAFFFLAVFMADLDFLAVYKKQYYRVLQGSELKITFLLAFMALFTSLSTLPQYAYISIAASLVVGVLTSNTTYMQILSFFYLRWNLKSAKDSPHLYYNLNKSATVGYAIDKYGLLETQKTDTICNLIALLLTFCYCAFAMHIARKHRPQPEIVSERPETTLSMSESEKLQTNGRIRNLGVVMLIGAFAVLFAAVVEFLSAESVHPIITLYVELYHVVLAIGIVSYALFQVLVSEHVSEHPLFSTSLLFLSAVVGLDIITQIDYRDTGEDLPFAWDIHVFVDFVSFYAHYLTIILLINLNPGPATTTSAELPTSFDNPLAAPFDEGEGYIQLRTTDVNELPNSFQTLDESVNN